MDSLCAEGPSAWSNQKVNMVNTSSSIRFSAIATICECREVSKTSRYQMSFHGIVIFSGKPSLKFSSRFMNPPVTEPVSEWYDMHFISTLGVNFLLEYSVSSSSAKETMSSNMLGHVRVPGPLNGDGPGQSLLFIPLPLPLLPFAHSQSVTNPFRFQRSHLTTSQCCSEPAGPFGSP